MGTERSWSDKRLYRLMTLDPVANLEDGEPSGYAVCDRMGNLVPIEGECGPWPHSYARYVADEAANILADQAPYYIVALNPYQDEPFHPTWNSPAHRGAESRGEPCCCGVCLNARPFLSPYEVDVVRAAHKEPLWGRGACRTPVPSPARESGINDF